jgi:hypothetical protein
LQDALATAAAQLRPYLPDDLEAGRDVLEHLGYILTEPPQFAAAVRTRIFLGSVGLSFTREMLGQRPAYRFRRF